VETEIRLASRARELADRLRRTARFMADSYQNASEQEDGPDRTEMRSDADQALDDMHGLIGELLTVLGQMQRVSIAGPYVLCLTPPVEKIAGQIPPGYCSGG
jgi:hypothetical protein